MKATAASAVLAVFAALGSGPAAAADWPAFRGGAGRTGYTSEPLPADLHLRWVHRPRHAPQPAWPGRDTRMPFDRAFHVAVAGGHVFFGSSADGKVRALDAATGEEAWSFHTAGPVRLTPAVWRGRVFAVSDDGFLYCLSAAEGKLLWKRRGGPTASRVLGNGRMISRWPARGGAVVADGIVYFGAGIWPSEGIYLYALDAATGKVLWRNRSAGSLYMPQPHGGANAASGVSVQGHLAVAGDRLLVPTGRAVPAAFARADGKLLYFHLQRYGGVGGSAVVADGSAFCNGGGLFEADSGTWISKWAGRILPAATPDGHVSVDAKGIILQPLTRQRAAGRPAYAKPTRLLEVALESPCSLIVAASAVVVADKRRVRAFDLATKKLLLTAQTDGVPYGLAAAGGQLYVSTDRGAIYCFGAAGGGEAKVVRPPARANPYGAAEAFEKAAGEIVRRAGITEGYCVDLGCGDGALAWALARRTSLHVIAVDDDPANVAAARRKLEAAGLYGTRVTVQPSDPAATGCGGFFANLVVSARSAASEVSAAVRAEAGRIARPFGGTVALGRPGRMQLTRRGPLAGAGDWTHQYADPANTGCSSDTLVAGPLGALWYGDFDFIMPSRHGRAPAPLFLDGRMFVEGRDALRCIDAYNGRTLWEHPLPGILRVYDGEHIMGTSGTGSNVCVARDGVYVRRADRCLRLEAATGKLLGELPAPRRPDGKPGTWGYVARAGKTLFGTLSDTGHLVTYRFRPGDMSTQFTESVLLFAMDPKTGAVKWTYRPKRSIRNNTIAIGGGRVFLIDRAVAISDRSREKRRGAPKHEGGTLVALDAASGRPVWSVGKDVYGTLLALSAEHGVLLMSYQKWRFALDSEVGGRMSAFRASDGKRLWDVEADGVTRPILNGRTIYFQPGAWDLLTGERKDFEFERSYGCGILSGSPRMLLYRSATLGYRDLSAGRGTENYGGIRPGCWINAIPAGGMVLMPDATDRCTCSYLIKSSIALAPFGLRAPVISPSGGDFARPVTVKLSSEAAPVDIRYTLDGGEPTARSARCAGAIRIAASTTLRASAFRDGLPPSQIRTASFVIDPNIIPLADPAWRVVDSPGGKPPQSRWELFGGYVTELSNHFVGSAGNTNPATDRPGTYRVWRPGKALGDGELSLRISSSDDDGLGVAVRYRGRDEHYLWAMDKQRGFHVLARRGGGRYRVLAVGKAGYERNRWYELRVTLAGPKIAVCLDGRKDLEADDAALTDGTFALYAWGCAGAKFRSIRWRATR